MENLVHKCGFATDRAGLQLHQSSMSRCGRKKVLNSGFRRHVISWTAPSLTDLWLRGSPRKHSWTADNLRLLVPELRLKAQDSGMPVPSSLISARIGDGTVCPVLARSRKSPVKSRVILNLVYHRLPIHGSRFTIHSSAERSLKSLRRTKKSGPGGHIPRVEPNCIGSVAARCSQNKSQAVNSRAQPPIHRVSN